ncbi:MerR family DNA-binding transcriptional regulator, partial [uncultured Deinococcus sp.]|uniref:MerR family DNA-binding transcriptional regulator n=1 Tax=uncultured Deinococcus sp. TaxID=158789 RepID=UPI00258BA51D
MASDAKQRPVYVISVAAELVDMHPQTLRLYERKGLIRPGRSSGKTRLYSSTPARFTPSSWVSRRISRRCSMSR